MIKDVLYSDVINGHLLEREMIRIHSHPPNGKYILYRLKEKTKATSYLLIDGVDFKENIEYIIIKINGGISIDYNNLKLSVFVNGSERSDPCDYITLNKLYPYICYHRKSFDSNTTEFLEKIVKTTNHKNILFFPFKINKQDTDRKIYPDSKIEIAIYGLNYVNSLDFYLC